MPADDDESGDDPTFETLFVRGADYDVDEDAIGRALEAHRERRGDDE
ncbi:MAG: hypothetical protein PPP55_08795 [Halorubrum sp.]